MQAAECIPPPWNAHTHKVNKSAFLITKIKKLRQIKICHVPQTLELMIFTTEI